MTVPTEGATELPQAKKLVSRTERSPAEMITVGKSDAGVCISCQQRLELEFAPNRFEDFRSDENRKGPRKGTLQFLARPDGLEPPTTWFEDRYS